MFNRGERISSLGGNNGNNLSSGNNGITPSKRNVYAAPSNAGGSSTSNNSNNVNLKSDLAEEQKLEIREAFQLFDMNGDGSLDYHETKVAFRALGFELTKREVLDIIHEYDTDDTNLLTYDNFYKTVGEMILKRDPLDEIRRAFKLFDVDGTGKISVRNLRKISRDLGENLSDEELQAMIDEFDLDEDGENIDKLPKNLQKHFLKSQDATALPTFKGFFPDKVPKSQQKTRFEAGIMEGDLAFVTEGPHKGKIVEVLTYTPEFDSVSLSNVSTKKLMPKPFWPEGHTSHVFDFPDYVPRSKVRVVGKEKDDSGKVSYVVAENVTLGELYYDERFKEWIPRRYIKNHDYELPWPEPSKIEDGELSTPPATVIEKTFAFDTIGKSTIPKKLVNQLRNPYSKFKRRALDGLQVAKLNGPVMPLTVEQKIWLAKQASKPEKKLYPLSEEIQDFIGSKMAQHLNKIESPELRMHLEALSNKKCRDFEKTLQIIQRTAEEESSKNENQN
ncbi:MRPL40 [Candida oxycetoniae]|uniref:MRPL40 n=1 Tax=Candida oxycetoniae TaxID=497107 RepID=A0AAI9WZ34_9ASCO|nr:MRPL40 [Candida oxycetoniae]KAI3405996.2 MRPL40 [Candida oxycetoniae]